MYRVLSIWTSGRAIFRACIAALLFTESLALILPSNIAAQTVATGRAEISGRVLGNDGSGVGGVTLSLIGVSEALTDSSGGFRFEALPPGTYFLRATRLGSRPMLNNITVAADERVRVDITLSSIAHELSAVVVRADSAASALSDPTGFQRRRRIGQGVFITGEEIEQRRAIRTEQLFLGVPNVRIDTGGIVLINRGVISYKTTLSGRQSQLGQQFVDCVGAQVFVDGALMPQPFDVNTIAPQGIRGIEVYRGPATTPPELRSPKTVCGTLAIWTR